MKKILLHTLLAAAFCLPAQAQQERMFTSDDVLSSNNITDILQDRYGFVWISTRDGLNCYDANQMAVFHKGDASGLHDNGVTRLALDTDSTLLIGTAVGVQTHDYGTYQFHDIPLIDIYGKKGTAYVTSIKRLPPTGIIITTSGHGIFIIKKGTREARQLDIDCGEFVNDAHITADGRLWVASTDIGLAMYEKGSKKYSHLFFSSGVERNMLSQVFTDKKGNLYVGTFNNGVYRYRNGQFEHIEATAGMDISSVNLLNDARIMLACDGQGAQILNPDDGTVRQVENASPFIDLRKAKVHTTMQDREGGLWIGIFQKGLVYRRMTVSGFKYVGHLSMDHNTIGSNLVQTVRRAHDGTIWVGTDQDGLYAIDGEGNQKKHYTNVPKTVMAVAEDGQGMIWIGSWMEGAGMLNPKTGQYTPLHLPADVSRNIMCAVSDQDTRVWFGTLGSGVLEYNTKAKTLTRYSHDNGSVKLYNDYIQTLSLSNDQQRLYIGMSNGLCCLNTRNDKMLKHNGEETLLLQRGICAVRELAGGEIWAGTTQGLALLSEKDTIFTIADGLPNDAVRSVEFDQRGGLWVSTNKGLSFFDLKTYSFVNYSVNDGIQGNEFSTNASFQHDGQFVFGGCNGLTLFYPDSMKRQQTKSFDVVITDMTARERVVTKGMRTCVYTSLDTTLMDTKRITLGHSDNSFSISFSARHFADPGQVIYEYRLNEGQWTALPQGTYKVNFSNMPTGHYRMQMRARIGRNTSSTREVLIRVMPPFYLTWVAKIIYALLAILAVWLLRKRYKRKQQEKALMRQQAYEAELNEAKIQFFMNVSHDIRTPMTLIVSPLKHLITTDKNPERQKQYKLMERNSDRILSLINQLLDLRKIDKGMMMMNFQDTDIVNHINNGRQLFEFQAKESNINFKFIHDTEKCVIETDPDAFEKIMMNVTGNAFKHTPEGGDITITLHNEGDKARIEVFNTGSHIAESELERIFDRFYQVANSGSAFAGTGVGLNLVRSIVNLHKGKIWAENSSNPQGCRFIITLPKRQHPEEAVSKPEQTKTAAPAQTAAVADVEEIEEDFKPVIVIAEDDKDIREYLAVELKDKYKVCTYPDGKEAWENIGNDRPDLLITDLMMPVMNGLELITKVRGSKYRNIPILMLTAKGNEEDILKGIETGADIYITKPFSTDVLKATINHCIERVIN